jgi:hypothetical protein
MGVTAAAHGDDEPATRPKRREGRLGPVFGEAVHLAIGLALGGGGITDAVARAAARVGLAEHLDICRADVERAIGALRSAGLLAEGVTLRLEYPLGGAEGEGTLLSGYADLVAAGADGLVVLDFKTDPPPLGPPEETVPQYVEQVLCYARLLRAAGLDRGQAIRPGLLFTADGAIRCVGIARRA